MAQTTRSALSSAGHLGRSSTPKRPNRPVSASGYSVQSIHVRIPGERTASPADYRGHNSHSRKDTEHQSYSGYLENGDHVLSSGEHPASSSECIEYHLRPRKETRPTSSSGYSEHHLHPLHKRSSRPASSTGYSGHHLHPKQSSRPASSSGYPKHHPHPGRPRTAPAAGHRFSKENMDRDDYPEGGGRGSRGGRRLAWQYSEDARKKHEELIRKILDDFDLEKTKEKYRNAYVIEKRRTGSSAADFQFRAEVERMMGSDLIRLNDKSWSKRFTERLLEDYYRYEEEQAKRRAEEEKQRLHKLKMLGLVEETVKYDRRLSLVRDRTQRLSELTGAELEKIEQINEINVRRQTLSERRQTSVYSHHPSLEVEPLILFHSDQHAHNEPEEPFSDLTPEEIMQQKAEANRKKKFSLTLPENVQKIYSEETVDGLYKMAEQLVHFQ